jgi:hypothetical protein
MPPPEMRQTLAALHVIGGHTPTLRVASRVRLFDPAHNSSTGVVIAAEPERQSCTVATGVDKPRSANAKSAVPTPSVLDVRQVQPLNEVQSCALRHSCVLLLTTTRMCHVLRLFQFEPTSNWKPFADGVFSACSTVLEEMRRRMEVITGLNVPAPAAAGTTPASPSAAASASTAASAASSSSKTPDTKKEEELPPTTTSDMLFSHFGSRLIKALSLMVSDSAAVEKLIASKQLLPHLVRTNAFPFCFLASILPNSWNRLVVGVLGFDAH